MFLACFSEPAVTANHNFIHHKPCYENALSKKSFSESDTIKYLSKYLCLIKGNLDIKDVQAMGSRFHYISISSS